MSSMRKNIVFICVAKETTEPPRLFNTFLDAFMTHLFCKPFNLLGVNLLGRLNQAFAAHAESHGLSEGFPWVHWQPSTSVLTSLSQVSAHFLPSYFAKLTSEMICRLCYSVHNYASETSSQLCTSGAILHFISCVLGQYTDGCTVGRACWQSCGSGCLHYLLVRYNWG